MCKYRTHRHGYMQLTHTHWLKGLHFGAWCGWVLNQLRQKRCRNIIIYIAWLKEPPKK